MTPAAIVWVALMIGFILVEAACPIHLVSVWFAAGALVSAIVAQFGGEIWLQVVVFLGVSIGALLLMWRYIVKILNPHKTKTNIDSVIGSQGYITDHVDNLNATGQVKLGGMYWTARSTEGVLIPEGTLVQVDRIEGVKVYVSPVEVKVTQ